MKKEDDGEAEAEGIKGVITGTEQATPEAPRTVAHC